MVRLLFVLLVVPLLAAGAGGAATSRPPPDVPLVLIESDRSGGSALYVASLDGRAIRQISRGEGILSSVSPDGRRVVISDEEGEILADSNGTRRRRLPAEADFQSVGAWSADGGLYGYTTDGDRLLIVDREGRRRAAFAGAGEGPLWLPGGRSVLMTTPGHSRVRVVASDGRGGRMLLEAPGLDVADAVWTRDGSKMVYVRWTRDERPDLYLAAADGSAGVRIVRDALEPTWSPDGKSVAFIRFAGDDVAHLWVADATGGRARRLTMGHHDRRPAWSPDGRSIVFDRSLEEGDESQLMSVAASGGSASHLGASLDAFDAEWLPAGSGLVATIRDGERTSIGLLSASGRLVRLLTRPSEDAAPSVSPDGAHIVFERNAQIAVMAIDGSAVRVLVSGAEELSSPRWSPEGVAFATVASGELAVWDVLDGSRRILARDLEDEYSAVALSPRGDVVAYVSVGRVHVRAIDGRLIRVIRGESWWLEWAPDGAAIALSPTEGRLRVLRAAGWKERSLDVRHTLAFESDKWGWHPGGRHIVRVRGDRLDLLDVRTGRARPLIRRMRGHRLTLPIWSRDGRSFAFDRERIPHLGSDVHVWSVHGGVSRRVTKPFPDGGTNQVLAWVRAPRPPAAPRPAVRRVNAKQVAGGRWIRDLRPAEDGVLYVSGRLGGACGRIHLLPSRRSLNPCRGGSPLVGAAVTAGKAAWLLYHEDEGIGDVDAVCLYVRAFGVALPRPRWTQGCLSGRGPGEEIAYGIGDETVIGPVEAAGGALVIGYPSWDEAREQDVAVISRVDGTELTPIARSGSLAILGGDTRRIVARRGRGAVVIYRANGVVERTLQFSAGSVLDAALDGSRLVVLRPNALEQYDLQTKKRLVRVKIQRGLGPLPRLAGASNGSAAYVQGAVVHLVRFSDRAARGLWFPALAPPVHAALTRRGLYVAYHHEGRPSPGVIRFLPAEQAFR